MKLIAQVTLVTKDAKGNTVEIPPGKEIDVDKEDVDSMVARGFATKPPKAEKAKPAAGGSSEQGGTDAGDSQGADGGDAGDKTGA